MSSPAITLFSPGDARDVTAWSGVPYGIATGLEQAGIRVYRENLEPGPIAAWARDRMLNALKRIERRHRRVGDLLLLAHEFAQARLAAARVRRACRRHSDVAFNLFLSYTVCSRGISDQPYALYMDQCYEELLSKQPGRPYGKRDRYLVGVQRANLEGAQVVFSTGTHCINYLRERYGLANVHGDPLYGINLYGYSGSPGENLCQKERSGSILFVARDFYERGGDLLVGAIDRLKSKGESRVVVDIVGPTRVAEWDRPWVKWHGQLRKDLPSQAREFWGLMEGARLFVMPCRTGPLPGVIREAQYVGTPVITANVWNSEQVIENGRTGLLVDGQSAEDYEAAITAALDDSLWRWLAEQGHRAVLTATWSHAGHGMVEALWEARSCEQGPFQGAGAS